MLNYYEILGLKQNATKQQVEEACKKVLPTPTHIRHEISRTLLNDTERVKYNRYINGEVDIRQTPVNWKEYAWWDTNYNGVLAQVVDNSSKLAKSGFMHFLYVVLLVVSSFALLFIPDTFLMVALAQFVFGMMWIRRRKKKPSKLANALVVSWNVIAIFGTLFHFYPDSALEYKVALVCSMLATMFCGFIMNELSHSSAGEHSKIQMTTKIPPKHIIRNYHWGVAGNLSDALGKFGYENVYKGETGEKYTAELFSQFEFIPGVRVFHGLKFPGSYNADVDHAILSGNNLIFVDSKQWSSGEYWWENVDMIHQKTAGGKLQPRETKFHVAVDRYASLLPKKLNVYGVILVHGQNVTILDGTANNQIVMANTKDGIGLIGQLLNDGFDNGAINRIVVNSLASSLK